MWGALLGIGLIAGLVKAAISWSIREDRVEPFYKARLTYLAGKPLLKLTLSEAEDGVVMSRKLKETDLEKRFAKVVSSLKKHRAKI